MAAGSPYGCWKVEDPVSKDDAIPGASPGFSELGFRIAGQGGAMHVIILESCNSTWNLEIDPHLKAFTVQLDEAHTRLIRSSIHSPGCAECGGYETVKLSLEDIRRAAA